MTIRFALAFAPILALLGAAPAAAQTLAPAAPAQAAVPAPKALPLVALTTPKGRIVVEVDTVRAPVTARNFLRYVDQKRLDGIVFYRRMDLGKAADGSGQGLIQAGVRGDPKRKLPAIAHEPTTTTGLSHVKGTVSMARGAPGTADGDFFFMVSDLVSLDADPAKPGDNAGFAVFGRVVEGMDVVTAIFAAPTHPAKGTGVMRGQMIAAPVVIQTARRVPPK